MMCLQLYFQSVQELQEFLEKFPDSKKYIELERGAPMKGVRTNKPWTQFEDEHIIAEYYLKPSRVIAEALHRTHGSTLQRMHKLRQEGLLRRKTKRNGICRTV